MSESTESTQMTPSANEEYCSSCGEIIKQEAVMCPECGVSQDQSSTPGNSSKDRTSAGIIALFLGGLGGHHFYLGNTKKGIVYLLFFWTFIPAIAAFIEGILYLTKSDEEFQRQYVND
jgi:TM2 domain-containing membrane protein YozV